MKLFIQGILVLAIFVLVAPSVMAEGEKDNKLATNCKAEYERYCLDVTPGKGRILACLYAYSDKASDQCRESLREAHEDHKLISAVTSHLKDECGEDLEKYCSDIPPGQGRLLNCLEKNDKNLSNRCTSALKEVGLKD